MPGTVISVENLSKSYRLGVIGTGTVRGDLQRWWARQRGKPDPYLRIGETDRGNRQGETIWALKDINFAVQQGEALGIIGRNGAGKSTLLKILSQVTAPTSGVVKTKGRIASLLEVGTGFHPELTGRENIYLNGAILGMKKTEIARKFDEIVDFSGVEKFIDTPVKRYSSGMYVRLAFAVAAYLEPEILVVDEVLAVGDAEFQKKCLGKMDTIAKTGRTVLFVSHNMAAITAFCKRAILLYAGVIENDGLAKNVIRKYLDAGATLPGERIWDKFDKAPGNDFTKIRRVSVNDLDHNIATDISSGQDFRIETEYWNCRADTKLTVTVVLINDNEDIILSSISNHETNWHGKPRPKGLFRSTCRIPANLLSPGNYDVTVLICTEGYMNCVREDKLVRFAIYDSGEIRGDYFGGYSGLVRPMLDWRTELLG
ncbi:MAG: ABC transporter ATP-binding protein [Chloroflexota bacterium]